MDQNDIRCNFVFSLPVDITPEQCAQEIETAIHKIVEQISNISFKDLKIDQVGTTNLFQKPIDYIYATQPWGETIK